MCFRRVRRKQGGIRIHSTSNGRTIVEVNQIGISILKGLGFRNSADKNMTTREQYLLIERITKGAQAAPDFRKS
jgi:hypothetical protein